MRRSNISLEDVASWENLSLAFWRAAGGKRGRAEVRQFATHLDRELSLLRDEILSGTVPTGGFTRFTIHDPKYRVIHAPVFRERVLHHALLAQIGSALDRSLVDDTYACRVGRGSLAAVRRAQHFVRRYPWYVKMDMKRYFDSIRHDRLLELLGRRLKNRGLLDLVEGIVRSYSTRLGHGLPIGALTSQHFANLYLAPMDRYASEDLRVAGMVRYMDDVVCWVSTHRAVLAVRDGYEAALQDKLGLALREALVQRSARGMRFCGFIVRPESLQLSRRRRRRYARAYASAEAAYVAGQIGAGGLQAAYASALATTAHADARAWRRAHHARLRPLEV